MNEFSNDDSALLERAQQVAKERTLAGLDGLVGDLEAVIVNTTAEDLKPAVEDFLRCTGHDFAYAYEDDDHTTCVLRLKGSADFLFRTRKRGENPFATYNTAAKSGHNTEGRLETFVYHCTDLKQYVAIQKKHGVEFMTENILDYEDYLFIQTMPSPYTGNSIGLVQWCQKRGAYNSPTTRTMDWSFEKPGMAHLANIGVLDHAATRVQAEHRDDAIIEFMRLTNYDFAFSVYVDFLNSITNVARLPGGTYAQVFTSGIKPFTTAEDSGPTELFIHNYGLRTHHLAFTTQNIETTFQGLKENGLDFLVDLVGSPEEGLKQTFSAMSSRTYLVNEYIHRYNGFDGFFTKSNVTLLTKATENQ